MVGGLVEQQQIGSRQQQSTQRHATTFAARKLRDVGVVGWTPQRIHGDLHVALQTPRVRCGDLCLEFGLSRTDLLEVGVGLAPHGGDLFVLRQQVSNGRDAVHHVAEHVLLRVELWFLCEQPHAESRCEAGFAAVAVVETRHDLEQTGLATAVGAEDADLCSRIERQ